MNRLLAGIVTTIAVATCCASTANAQTTPLSQARGAFQTQISFSGDEPRAPTPPASVFRKITYPSAVGLAPTNEIIARKILNDLPSHKQFEMTGVELQTQAR